MKFGLPDDLSGNEMISDSMAAIGLGPFKNDVIINRPIYRLSVEGQAGSLGTLNYLSHL